MYDIENSVIRKSSITCSGCRKASLSSPYPWVTASNLEYLIFWKIFHACSKDDDVGVRSGSESDKMPEDNVTIERLALYDTVSMILL